MSNYGDEINPDEMPTILSMTIGILKTTELTDSQKLLLGRLNQYPDQTAEELSISLGWKINKVNSNIKKLKIFYKRS